MHEHKKAGQRKDKKSRRMHEAVEDRQLEAEAKPERPTTDQHDIQTFKPGSAGDRSSPQNRPHIVP